MKRLLILITFFLFGYVSRGQSKDTTQYGKDKINLKRDTILRNLLVKVNLTRYIGKTVGQLLTNDTIKQFTRRYWSDEPPGVLDGLVLIYARGLSLTINA